MACSPTPGPERAARSSSGAMPASASRRCSDTARDQRHRLHPARGARRRERGRARLRRAHRAAATGPATSSTRFRRPRTRRCCSALAQHTEPANLLAVRVAVLTLLAHLAESAPVLVTIDDAQWVDESSIEALAFAARRLAAERVAVARGRRAARSRSCSAPDAGVEHVVTGLDDIDAARHCSRIAAGCRAAPPTTWCASPRGNPLALLELPDVAGSVPRAVEVSSRRRSARACGTRSRPDSRSSRSRPGWRSLSSPPTAIAGLGEIARRVRDARPRGRCARRRPNTRARDRRRRPGRTAPPAACARSRITRSSAPERRDVHAALAAALARPGDIERRTWHRAAASLGPDESVALALEDVARSRRASRRVADDRATASRARPGSAPMTTPERAG